MRASVDVLIRKFGRRVRLINTWEKNRTTEGEEESSLGVTGDKIDLGYEERPVNRYGSPIALPESTDHEEAGPSQALPSRVVSSNEARMSNFYYRFVGYKRLRICVALNSVQIRQSASARIPAAEKQENIGDVCAGMPVGDAR